AKQRDAAAKPSATPIALSGKLYLHRGDHELAIYDPQKKTFTDLPELPEKQRLNYQDLDARLSFDGHWLAFGQAEDGHPPSQLQIREVAKQFEPKVVVDLPGKELSSWSWSPDG